MKAFLGGVFRAFVVGALIGVAAFCFYKTIQTVDSAEPAPTAPPTYLDDPDQLDPVTLKVIGSVAEVTVGSGTARSRGSGTLVGFTADGKAIVLSCRHVCETVGAHASVEWPQYGETSFGSVVYVEPGQTPDWSTDLAIIICDRPKGIAPVKVAPFCPSCGPFTAVGWRDRQIRVAFAERAAIVDGAIKTNAPFVGGQSGGALFDKYGRLVGVTVASSHDYGLSSIPLDLLKKFQYDPENSGPRAGDQRW